MAENLRFPIVFDLEKGVEAAIKDWDGKYADKLEKAIQKRALNVKLKFDTKAFDNLDDVKRRLAELKITPLTPENKTAIRELVRELKELARIMEKIQKFKGIELPELQMAKAAKLRKDVEQANEKMRLSQERVRISNERLILSQQRAAQQAQRTGKAFGNQSGYLERLIKKMAVYASFRMVGNFLTSVREVTAEFELQRVSLGAILQDANKGEQIFSQIKQFALSSPLSILDLTKYTKQLAAYKIEYDELFDMTKRLADISVGIGADFQRIVLAAGQTRTATYLRASELKQFTELGVPLLEELSIKLSKMNGEMVTTAEVMDLISQRAISWELVKEVLYDMTDAGGMFYDMQVKQSQTLYGLWQKLGDAASVMYAQIGETSFISSGMKEAIQLLTELMRNWKAAGITAATTILPAVAAMAAWKMATKALAKSVATATSERIAAEAKLATAMKGTDIAAQNAARSTLAKAKADEAAAIAAQKNATAQSKLKMGFVSLGKTLAAGLGISIVIALITELIYKISEAVTNFHKLENELGAIYTETFTLQDQSVRNFEFLADKAVKAANGSKEQKDALDELSRTYRDILPQEALTIENLARMKGNYDALTQSIKEHIAEQQRQKAESTIYDYYNPKISESQGVIRERLLKQGVSATEVGRFFVEFQKKGDKVFLFMEDKFRDAMEKAGVKSADKIKQIWDKEFAMEPLGQPGTVLWINKKLGLNSAYNDLVNLNEAYHNQAAELEGLSEQYHDITGEYGAFAEKIKQAKEELANIPYVNPDGSAIDQSTILFQQIKDNDAMKKAAQLIREDEDLPNAIRDKEVEWNDAWIHLVESVDPDDLFDITTIDFDAMIKAVEEKYPDLANRIKMVQKEWGNVAPTDATVLQINQKLVDLSKSFDPTLSKMKQFLWDGSGEVDDYLKRLKEQQDNLKKRLKEKQNTLLQMGILSKWWNKLMGKDIEAEVEQMKKEIAALDQQIAFTTEYTIPDDKAKSRGTKSDTRLQNLKEEISLYEKLYQEYKQYEKAVGSSKAAEYMEREARDTIDALAKKYGIGLPKTATDLTSALEILYKKMQALPSKVFKNLDKELKEFRWKIEKVDIDESQKQIEAELKRLADRISRTKTAKEFYEKILGMTGDVELAANVSLQIYGSTGKELSEQIKEQFRLAFATLDKPDAKVSAKIGDLIDKGRFEELRDYISLLPEAQRKAAEDLVKAQQQMSAKQYEQWLKDLEKAKDYADKRIELSRYTANQIAAIEERIAKLDPAAADYEQQKEMLQKLIDGYKSRESKEAAGLDYEQFKNSALYVQVFENLDNASKTALENMRSRLLALKDQWKNLSPEKVKELTKRLEELDAQIAQRNPFKSIADSIKKLREMRMSGRTKEGDAQIAFDAEADRQAAEAKMLADEKAYEAAVKQYGAESDIAKAKRKIAEDSAAAYRRAEQAADSAAENADEWEKVSEAINAANQKIDEYQQQINEALDGIRKIMESFGASAEDMQFFDDVTNGFNEIFDAGQQGAAAYADFMQGNFVGAATKGISAVGSLISGVTNLFYAGRVKRANKEIKRQQELLDQLEYTYGRLEKAAGKVFGRDYLNNYNSQIKNLQAQQQAYLKQAQAERSKGKKEDKEKTKQFEEQARETADKIKELQDDLVAHFTGSSKTDVARQMAKSWVDARASMSDTFAAIKGDYQDLIKNMIVEGAAARVIENALTPVWDSMEKMLAKNDVEGAIDSLVNGMDSALNAANNGMEVLWKALEARGYDMKKLISGTDSEYTGIAKNIAGATSEEINNVAAIGNTLLYYAAPIPRIDENLARVVALMEGRGASAIPQTTSAGWTDWQQQAMDNYIAIQRNTADTVVECRRAAEACERITRLIKTKGAVSGFNVFLNS